MARQVEEVPEITLTGQRFGGQADDAPGYFYFGDISTLNQYLNQPSYDPFAGVDQGGGAAPELPPPPPPPQLVPAPPLVPITPPAPPANDPAPPRAPAPPRQVEAVPEITLTAPRITPRAALPAIASGAAIAGNIFAELLLPHVYRMFGRTYDAFLGLRNLAAPTRRLGGDPSRAPASTPVAPTPAPAPRNSLTPVQVTGTRAAPAPFATPLLSPNTLTNVMMATAPALRPLAPPRARPAPRTRALPRVDARVATSPLQAWRNALNPRLQPSFNLGPRAPTIFPLVPQPNIPPVADRRPAPGPSPSPYVPPFNNPLDSLSIAPRTVPQPALDRCGCPKPKERKPREPRSQCRQGTYTQTAKGIIYTPRRTVPCR